jgi:hypothetical protein
MAVTEQIHLATGWEPDGPVADTVLRRFVYAWAESLTGLVAAVGGRVQRRDGLVLDDLARPAAYYNGATLLRPPAPDEWEALVGEGGPGDVVTAALDAEQQPVVAGEPDRRGDVVGGGRLDDERGDLGRHGVPDPDGIVPALIARAQ